MRKTHKKQLSLVEPAPVHPKAQEWAEISRILDRNIIIYEKALQDLTRSEKHVEVGSEGMTAEQVVRVSIIKQLEKCSCQDLHSSLSIPLSSVSSASLALVTSRSRNRHCNQT